MRMSIGSSEQSQGLRALRGIAALLVFFQHIFWQANLVSPGPAEALYALGFGGIGVLCFFALSAFLISGKASDPPGRFLVERLRRVVPGFWAALLLAAVLDHVRVGHYGLTWQLFALIPAGEVPAVTVPYWTLYYEALLYAVIFVVARVSVRCVGPAILVWAVVAWIWQDRPYGNGHYLFPTWYHLAMPIFAGFFGVGVLVSWRSRRPVRAGLRRPLVLANFALALICFGTPFLMKTAWGHTWLYAMPYAVLPAVLRPDVGFLYYLLGTAFALRAAVLWRATGWGGRVLGMFGDLSYGIYLIHISFMAIGGWLIARSGIAMGYATAAVVLTLFALPLSMLFGWWEFRLQQWLKRKLHAWRSRRLKTPLEKMVPAT